MRTSVLDSRPSASTTTQIARVVAPALAPSLLFLGCIHSDDLLLALPALLLPFVFSLIFVVVSLSESIDDGASDNSGGATDALSGMYEFRCARSDVIEYATHLGMDVQQDAHLLWIADRALLTPDPPGWEMRRHTATGRVEFYHAHTDSLHKEHPVDKHYRLVYLRHKAMYEAHLAERAHKAASSSDQQPLALPSAPGAHMAQGVQEAAQQVVQQVVQQVMQLSAAAPMPESLGTKAHAACPPLVGTDENDETSTTMTECSMSDSDSDIMFEEIIMRASLA